MLQMGWLSLHHQLWLLSRYGRKPFLVLVGCILSLRTKDTVSLPASIRLFECARTPQELLNLSIQKIQELIYPVGFYRRKAETIHKICHQLLQKHGGIVPSNEKDLLNLSGVGRKTALFSVCTCSCMQTS